VSPEARERERAATRAWDALSAAISAKRSAGDREDRAYEAWEAAEARVAAAKTGTSA